MWFLTFVRKNIWRRKTRSAATVVGVAIAVGSMAALVGVSDGFESAFADIFQKRGVDLLVVKAGATQRLTSILDASIGDRLRQLPGVEQVIGGLVDVAAFEDGDLIGVTINGAPLESPLIRDPKILSGRRLQAGDRRSVMIGKLLASRLNKKPGDAVEIETEQFAVAGVFESYNVYENGSVVLLLDEMQQLMDRPGKVSGFIVTADDSHSAEADIRALCRRIEQLRDEHGKSLKLEAQPTSDYVATTVEIRTVKAMAWGTSAIALLIGCVAMFNTMIMSVFERTAEIGILRGIGWRRRRIAAMIVCESLLLSLAGGALGAAGAVVLVRLLGRMPQVSGLLTGHISPMVLLEGMGLGLLLGAAAGLYPGLRAAFLTPTEALRHD
jgi:putative ABC transport system permease protein